jgi:SAM-dependent methyltransferase
MNGQPDTFDRSMAHWSEAGRAEMDAFYRVASRDYRELALAHDWNRWLGDTDRILDVACGSGKFPVALSRHASLTARPRTLDLLDPSRFSIEEAARNLEPPFRPGRQLETRLQDLDGELGPWSAVWATHALYAIPPHEMTGALERFVQAIAPGGSGFIAHARADSFYLAFHRAYLRGWKRGVGTRFSTAEDLLEGFDQLGVPVQVRDIEYVGELGADQRTAAQGFLQRCLFDETVSLDAMEQDPEMGPLLTSHRATDGGFRFPQRVAMVFLAR